MESLQDILSRMGKGTQEQSDSSEWFESLLQHPYIRSFLKEDDGGNVSDDVLERSLPALYQAAKEYDHCNDCPGLANCPNLVWGHRSELQLNGQMIEPRHAPCPKFLAAEDQRRRERLISSHHVPKDIMQASFADFEMDTERVDALKGVMEFCRSVQPGEGSTRGLYLYGPLGVGKSHLMGAATRKLADRGISSLMVYSPDFFREIKEAIQEQTVKEKVDALREVPVLILDDIGAESLSPWSRDEILGAILQYRMSEHLPTLYTSNYDYEQLEKHLAESTRGETDELKAKRIMERIRYFTDAYMVGGRNRRG